MAASKLHCERVSTERIEKCIKSHGPLNTIQLRRILGLTMHSATQQISKCPNVRCIKEHNRMKVWDHVDNLAPE